MAPDDPQTPEPGPQKRTAEEIQEWFIAHVADLKEVAPGEIDVTVPFDDFALESTDAIGMTGDLEDWLSFRIDPTVVYDYPTIEALSQYLADEISKQ